MAARFTPAVMLVTAVAFAGCATASGGSSSSTSAGSSAAVGAPAPDLSVQGWDGKPLRLSQYRGKVVLLDLWASWCVPCKAELPALDAMATRLRGRNIEILAVSVDEDRRAAEGFLKSKKRWALTFAHDPSGAVPDRLQPGKMPTSYIIDAAGIVRHVNEGYQPGDEDKLEARLLELAR